MTVTPLVSVHGEQLVEVYRRHGERRPAGVKGWRLRGTETGGLDGKRDMYEVPKGRA
mgnify:CR=1 FL=1